MTYCEIKGGEYIIFYSGLEIAPRAPAIPPYIMAPAIGGVILGNLMKKDASIRGMPTARFITPK